MWCWLMYRTIVLHNLFRQRWLKENLPLLQEVVDSNAPRNSWPMGKVVHVIPLPDKYGLVRQGKVKTSNINTTNRQTVILEAE